MNLPHQDLIWVYHKLGEFPFNGGCKDRKGHGKYLTLIGCDKKHGINNYIMPQIETMIRYLIKGCFFM